MPQQMYKEGWYEVTPYERRYCCLE
jgi:hypothetical protein